MSETPNNGCNINFANLDYSLRKLSGFLENVASRKDALEKMAFGMADSEATELKISQVSLSEEKMNTEEQVRQYIEKVLCSPLNKNIPNSGHDVVIVDKKPLQLLYNKLKQILENKDTNEDPELESYMRNAVAALAPDHPFLKQTDAEELMEGEDGKLSIPNIVLRNKLRMNTDA